MTTEEFSNEFDVLLNSYASAGALDTFELNEYEKSVFLTNAQEEIIIGVYNGKNPFEDSFEKTEEIRRYLSELVKTYTTTEKKLGYKGISKSSTFFELPKDLWFITYEAVDLKDDELKCTSTEGTSVVPITLDEYHRIKKNPFRGTNERRALRLDCEGGVVEIISKYNIEAYLVRYLSKPTPIILEDLKGVTINDEWERLDCKLNPVIHRTILERAVKLAIMSRIQSTGENKTIV